MDVKQWGGKRDGAGRKAALGERKEQKTVRLPPSWIESLEGEFGNFQAAVETLVKEHLEHKSTQN